MIVELFPVEITPSCVLAAETDRFSTGMSQLVVLFASFVATIARLLLLLLDFFFFKFVFLLK